MNNLQFYLVSSSSAAPWPGALPLQLRDPNYGNGDTNTFSKRMFEQFTQYLTGWQICQLPLSFEGSKLFSFRGASGFAPLIPAPGPRWGLRPQTPATTPPLQNPMASPLAARYREGLCSSVLQSYTVCAPGPAASEGWRVHLLLFVDFNWLLIFTTTTTQPLQPQLQFGSYSTPISFPSSTPVGCF